ncbi:MAG TPA: hypothetical protein VGE93_10810 [Bryobacteraceae bacterium]
MLQLLIINRQFVIGPRWLSPSLEALLLIPLSFATAWTQWSARDAQTDEHWRQVAEYRRSVRRLALALTALISIANFASLVALVGELVGGKITVTGESLLFDAMNIWITNVIAFTLWFWNLDRGGPSLCHLGSAEVGDFLFPQMTRPEFFTNWTPGFMDYFYVSFTNATAFSPTDTMPLSVRAKMLMLLESAVSLMTLALVAARAVNILK